MLTEFECADHGGAVWIDVTAVTGLRLNPGIMKDAEGKLVQPATTFVYCGEDSYHVVGEAKATATRINEEREAFYNE